MATDSAASQRSSVRLMMMILVATEHVAVIHTEISPMRSSTGFSSSPLPTPWWAASSASGSTWDDYHNPSITSDPEKTAASEFLHTMNRIAADRLDQIIVYHLSTIPARIARAAGTVQTDLSASNLKSSSQGWSIVIASWKDILSDLVINNRSAQEVINSPSIVNNYGYIFSYGLGFGLPLLLGLPDADLATCDPVSKFVQLVRHFGLDTLWSRLNETQIYYDGIQQADFNSVHALRLDLKEFKIRFRANLFCLLENVDNYIDVTETVWAVDELATAIEARIQTVQRHY